MIDCLNATGRKRIISSGCVWEHIEDVLEKEPNNEKNMGTGSVGGQWEDLLRPLHFHDTEGIVHRVYGIHCYDRLEFSQQKMIVYID